MAISKIPGAGVSADTLEAGDIAANAIGASELANDAVDTAAIADDAITGGKLANDVAISTSGAITTTGAFTSIGIDDNADALTMTIDSSERVGIGTNATGSFNNQAERLIVGDGTGDEGITIFSGAGAGDTGNLFFADSGNPVQGGISYDQGNNKMLFRINDSNKMIIDSSGHVAFGAAPVNPGGMYKSVEISATSETQFVLHATSNSLSTNARIGQICFNVGSVSSTPVCSSIMGKFNGNTDSGYLTFHCRNTETGGTPTERVRFTADGKVGIGTSSPSYTLDVVSPTTGTYPLQATTPHAYLRMGAQNTTFCHFNSNVSSGVYFYNSMWAAGYNTISDEKFKKNIQKLSGALSLINNIRGVTFEWKGDEYPELKFKSGIKFGVIAQEVEAENPNLIQIDTHPTDSDVEMKTVEYSNLIPYLIEAVKELSAKVTALEAA